MSVIIRLQGLPWTANALDIRQYFEGLTIPEGGVHIVGGDDGDAFIAFSSDEDARQAMLMDGGRIKDAAKVKLMLSSRTEMQKVIEAARNRNLVMQGLLAASAAVAGGQGSSVGGGPMVSSQLPTGGSASQLQMESASSLAGKLPATAGAASELSLQQQLFMNRAAAAAAAAAMSSMPAGSQMPFQLQQLKLSTMEMLQGDMRQLMMQNMGLGIGSNAQSILPNADNAVLGLGNLPSMATSPSYEPTKKSMAPTIVDRDQQQQQQQQRGPNRDRDSTGRERDRDRDRDGLGRRANRGADRRGSRSPRRRSRDRDRDATSRRRDRRRSTSRGRSRERSNDRTRVPSSSGGRPVIEPFINNDSHDRDAEAIRRRLLAEANGCPVHTVNGRVVLPASDDNSPQRNNRWNESGGSDTDLNAADHDRGSLPPQKMDSNVGGGGGVGVSDNPPWNRDGGEKPQMQQQQQQRPSGLADGAGGLAVHGPRLPPNRNSLGQRPPLGPMQQQQQQQQQPLQQAPRQNGPFGLNARQPQQAADRMTMSSLCIVMRGIPFDTHPLNIREYFQGLNIPPDGIRLLIDTVGSRPHLAFVRFTNEFDRDIVLKRQTHYFQGLLVEVMPCTEEEFMRVPSNLASGGRVGGGGIGGPSGGPGEINVWSKEANQRFQEPGAIEDESCVFIKGIPYKCVEKDIYDFFDGYRIVDALIEYLRPGKSAGTGFAEFVTPMEARRALELNGQKMDFRKIDLRLSTKQSMITARRQTTEMLSESPFLDRPSMPGMMMQPSKSPMINSSGGGNNDGGNFGRTDCCLITGLPLNATDRDILDFFAPAEIAPMVIHVMLDMAGRPMGDAFCEFGSPRECHRAVQMDRLPLRETLSGPRFLLNIRPVTRMELDAALGSIPAGGPTVSTAMPPDAPPGNSGLRSNGGGLSSFGPNQNVPAKNVNEVDDGGPVKNKNAAVTAQPTSPRGQHPQTIPTAIEQSSPIKQQQQQQQQQQSPNMQRSLGPSFFGRPSEPGCILEVQNLPFLSTSEDILKHFQGFGLTKESIMRRFRENGAPTGDARLLFHSPKDAQMAYRQLNSVIMCGRVLNMKILT